MAFVILNAVDCERILESAAGRDEKVARIRRRLERGWRDGPSVTESCSIHMAFIDGRAGRGMSAACVLHRSA